MLATQTSLRLDHVEMFVADAHVQRDTLVRQYGFEMFAQTSATTSSHRSFALRQGTLVLVLTEGRVAEHPASAYVARHGDGVADIAFRTDDIQAAYSRAVAAGARPLQRPTLRDGIETACVGVFGDVRHSLVRRGEHEQAGARLPGLFPMPATAHSEPIGLLRLDHVAVCVEAGALRQVVAVLATSLGLAPTFTERIVVGKQAMQSQVVRNAAGDVTFTIIEPDTDCEPGQIDSFLACHGGAGVQHLAFLATDIVHAIRTLRANGIDFLKTPGSYYDRLLKRLAVDADTAAALRALDVLADDDENGRLYQIFARSTHPRRTFFFELIQRTGATTFGSRNIKALYESVERACAPLLDA
jgi:4-hydroxymandelate synthase